MSVVMLMVMGQTSVLWLNAIMLWSPGVTKGGVALGLGGWWAPSRCAVCSAAGGLVCADSKQRLGGTGLDWYCSIQGCRCCQWCPGDVVFSRMSCPCCFAPQSWVQMYTACKMGTAAVSRETQLPCLRHSTHRSITIFVPHSRKRCAASYTFLLYIVCIARTSQTSATVRRPSIVWQSTRSCSHTDCLAFCQHTPCGTTVCCFLSFHATQSSWTIAALPQALSEANLALKG